MNQSNKWSLKSWINRMLEDGFKKIEAKHLTVFSHNDIEVIEESIRD